MKLINFALVITTLSLVGLFAGCASLTPQTKSTIAQIQNKSAVDQAKATAAAKLDQLNGKNKPVTHPLAAANETVAEIRPYLVVLALFSFTAWAIEFGLSFTAFSFLSFLAPVFRWVAILSISALIALPWLPLGIVTILAALVGLFIYELVKTKGNVVEAFDDTESQLGFATAAVTKTTATATTATALSTSAVAVTQTATATPSTATPSTAAPSGLSAVVADVEADVKKLV